jgi:hypothetical protein
MGEEGGMDRERNGEEEEKEKKKVQIPTAQIPRKDQVPRFKGSKAQKECRTFGT